MSFLETVYSACPPALRSWLDRHTASPERKRLLRETVVAMLGQVVSAAGVLVGFRLVTELAPPEVFGSATLLIGVLAFVENTFCLPFLQAVLRLYPDQAAQGNLAGLRAQVLSVLRSTGICFALAAVLMAAFGSGALGVSPLAVLLLIPIFAVEMARQLSQNFLTAARRQTPYVIWMALESIARPLLGACGLYLLAPTVEALFLGYLAATAGTWILFRVAVLRKVPATAKPDAAAAQSVRAEMRRYALPLLPMAAVAWVTAQADRYIIAALAGLSGAGIYAAAYGLIDKPFGMAATSLTVSFRPVYFNAISEGNRDRARRVLRYWAALTALICAAGVAGVWLLAELIARLALAESYRGAAALFPWLAAGFALQKIAFVLDQVCYAHKRTELLLYVQVTVSILSLASAAVLVPIYGALGAAMAVPIYFGAHLLLNVAVIRFRLKAHFE